jgi:hypothetical protein
MKYEDLPEQVKWALNDIENFQERLTDEQRLEYCKYCGGDEERKIGGKCYCAHDD